MPLLEIENQPLSESDQNEFFNQPGKIGSFRSVTIGSGANVGFWNVEGIRFGSIRFDDANAWIKNDGSYSFKDANGNVVMDVDGVQSLADASVTTAALANLSVDVTKLANLAVDASKLANSAVTTTKIANAAVGAAAIANLAVGTAHVANGAILNAKIGNAQITNAKISSLNADKITAGTLTGRVYQTNASTSGKRLTITTGTANSNINSIIRFYYNNVSVGNIYMDTDENMVSAALHNAYVIGNNDAILRGLEEVKIEAQEIVTTYYDGSNGSHDVFWRQGSTQYARMKLNQSGDLDIDGSYGDSGADYAEFFENKKSGVISPGFSVVLDGDKVRKAKRGEDPLGVISIKPTMVGNNGKEDVDSWNGKYLKSEDNNYVTEKIEYITAIVEDGSHREKITGFVDEVKLPKNAKKIKRTKKVRKKINPDYDPKKEYMPRSERPEEWSVVGLIGQMWIRKGQPIGKNWIKMKQINDKYDLYFIK